MNTPLTEKALTTADTPDARHPLPHVGKGLTSICRICLVLALFTLFSCSSPQVSPEGGTYGGDADQVLFEKAEKKFNAQSYRSALKHYQKYLEDYPNGKMVPACLLKLGSIESHDGNYETARAYFDQLIRDFPDSYFVPDAHMEYLFTYLREERYQEVIDRSEEIMAALPDTYALRLNMLRGDAFMGLENPKEAFFAYTKTPIDLSLPEGEKAGEKIKAAVSRLNASDIITMLGRVEDNRSLSYLMYRLGVSYAEEGNLDDAVKILTGFVAAFPDHDNIPEAKQLVADLQTRAQSMSYVVGCLLPLSGPYKAFGEKALKGIETALAGIDDLRVRSRIRIIIKDTASDPETTVQAVEELAQEEAVAILGPITTPEAGAEKAQELGIPVIVLSQKPGIADMGDHVFRNFITPAMQVKAIAEYVFNELELNRFAILYPDEKYGETFMNLFWDEVLRYGGTITGVEPYNNTHTDFSGPIKKLIGLYYHIPDAIRTPVERAHHPYGEKPEAIVDFDAIFIPDASDKAGLIVPQLTYHDITNVRLIGTNLWHSDTMLRMAHKDAQGAIIPEGFFQNSTHPKVRTFVQRFNDRYGETPGYIEAIAFDTAGILFAVAEKPNAYVREGVRRALLNLNHFDGVTGDTSFKENGEADKACYILQIKGDRFVELEKTYKRYDRRP